jgi:dihydroorotate dehydrogenase electron transfer subunit
VRRARGGITEGRTEGPVHATCEVIARRREGAYWLVSVAAREIAERAQPGQFVQVAVEAQDTLLRRPFSIARVSRQGASAGTVDIVFDAHGPGTSWLTGVETHDVLDLVGPLGTPFPLPQRKVNCLLVGGGYGIAPLYYLAEILLRRGLRVDMINGASTAERIMGAIEAKRLSASVSFTTEDGSYGTQGRVTDVLDQVIATSKAGLVYACGPNPMLRAVSERCVQLGIPVQVVVEERMGCGIGVCFTCVVPIVGRDGAARHKRACVEGPVFNGARIGWDRWGVPGGAPVAESPSPAEPAKAETTAAGGRRSRGTSASPAAEPPRARGTSASAAAEAPRARRTSASPAAEPPRARGGSASAAAEQRGQDTTGGVSEAGEPGEPDEPEEHDATTPPVRPSPQVIVFDELDDEEEQPAGRSAGPQPPPTTPEEG